MSENDTNIQASSTTAGDTEEGCLSAGPQAPPPEIAGGNILGEEGLGISARTTASATQPWIRA